MTLPPTFLATSPIVREILAKDIAEWSSEDETEQAPRSDAESEANSDLHPSAEAKLAFHPNGVAYGCGYSVIPLQGLDRPVPNPSEVEESVHAALCLLRDNAILPPKHPRPRPTNILARMSRRIFSTKVVKDHDGPVFPDTAVEATPLLLEGTNEGLLSPAVEDINHCFEDAVAAGAITTTWQREAKTLVQYSIPLICTFLMHYLVTIGSVLTVGRLGMVELAAVNCM